jgi:hypothetical protein
VWRTESQKAKIRLAAKHADQIRKAIRKSVDVNRAVTAWMDTHPVKDVTSIDDIRAWADGHIYTDGDPLRNALGRLYAESWVLGGDIADTAILAVSNKPLMSLMATKAAVGNANWDDWKAGNRPASILVNPPDAFSKLMASRKVDIQGINRTTTDRIGTILGDALSKGQSPYKIAGEIEGLLNDPERALMIAQTEMSRAVSVASRNTYLERGMDKVEWFPADPCDICAENASVGAISIDAEFPSGDTEPPAHPYCRCTLAPAEQDPEALLAESGGGDDAQIEPISVANLPKPTTGWREGSDLTPEEMMEWLSKKGSPEDLEAFLKAKAGSDMPEGFQAGSGFSASTLTATERRGIAAYTGQDYEAMNGMLRGNGYLGDNAAMQKKIDAVNSAIAKAPPLSEPIITYRGMKGNTASKIANLNVGAVYTDEGFYSTALDKGRARGFTHTYNDTTPKIIIEIFNPIGTQGIDLDGAALSKYNETEWLLPSGTKFEIIEKTLPDNDNTVYIKAKVVLP